MGFIAGVFRLIVGAAFGLACALALSPALASIRPSPDGQAGPMMVWAVIALVAAAGWFAPSIRRSFGRGFLLLGLCLLALPLSTALLSGSAASEVINASAVEDQGYAVIGAGLGAVAVTGVATFIGLILGSISIILGLVLALGGRREVIMVEPASPPSRRQPSISARR